MWNPKHLSVLYNLVHKGHKSANMLCEDSHDIFKHISITRSVWEEVTHSSMPNASWFSKWFMLLQEQIFSMYRKKMLRLHYSKYFLLQNVYFIYFLLACHVKQKMHRNHIEWHITWMSKLKKHQKKLTSLKRLDHSCMWILKNSLSGKGPFATNY